MSSVYVPGKLNPYFPKHKFHGVKVYGSYQRIEECKLHHYVGPAATVEKAVAAYVLSPEQLWATFQEEAENLIKVNGSFDGREEERNKRINAAYAKLWLADNRFQWAGLAAFASKQVGCGLLHAAKLSERNNDELRAAVNWAGSSTEAAGLSAVPAMIRNGADFMHKQLGFGNEHLFLDIYPLHRFFMERGWKELNAYLDKRHNKKYPPAYWNVNSKVLPFGTPFQEIRKGFQRIEEGDLAGSVESLAWHEQVNILQRIMYNDPGMQDALAKNQLAWAMHFPSGIYTEIQLTLSAQCKAKDGWTSFFPSLKSAKLWLVEERMQFVKRAATRFEELLRGRERPYVEESLRAIAAGRGVE
jgi:hypothetical protein